MTDCGIFSRKGAEIAKVRQGDKENLCEKLVVSEPTEITPTSARAIASTRLQ
jgi:hypothetical protein